MNRLTSSRSNVFTTRTLLRSHSESALSSPELADRWQQPAPHSGTPCASKPAPLMQPPGQEFVAAAPDATPPPPHELFVDAVTSDIMSDPVFCDDGRTYDRTTAERLVNSPFTRLPLRILGSNIALRSAIWDAHPEQQARYPKPDSSVYTGDKDVQGLAQGHGVRTYVDGTVESGRFEGNQLVYGKRAEASGNTDEGQFVATVLHGEGTRTFVSGPNAGQRLQGLFDAGQCYLGSKTYPRGEVYQGSMRDGIEHGRGTWRDAAGTTYSGLFEGGLRHGRGKARFANGDSYDGFWERDSMQGWGIFHAHTNEVYEGNWAHGRANGLGKRTYANGNTYEGAYVDNLRHGVGTFSYVNGKQYTGDWVQGQAHGQGIRIDASGDRYAGGWIEGRPHGVGQRINADGAQYVGDWAKGKMSGFGRHIWPTGHVYTGLFEGSMRHGHGIFEFPNGGRFVGDFEHDKRAKRDATCTNFKGRWGTMPATMNTLAA